MMSDNLGLDRAAARLTGRLHSLASARFARYRIVAEGADGHRGLVRLCRSEDELASRLRELIRARHQTRRAYRGSEGAGSAEVDRDFSGAWFVPQVWVGSAFGGAWRDFIVGKMESQRWPGPMRKW
jgi:hypothetical protein